VSLALIILLSLYRNWRYQFYALRSSRHEYFSAEQRERRSREELFRKVPGNIAIQTGKPIDYEVWHKDFLETDAEMSKVLQQWEKKKDNIFKETVIVESVALVLVVFSILTLVCLAWRNF
jgi:hypothetical protein